MRVLLSENARVFCAKCERFYPVTVSRCDVCLGWLHPNPPAANLEQLGPEMKEDVSSWPFTWTPKNPPVPVSADELAVYGAALPMNGLVLAATQVEKFGTKEIQALPEVHPETISGFVRASWVIGLLHKLGRPVLPQLEYQEIFESKAWDEFYRRYPESGGIVKVSRVGFNHARTQALLTLSHLRADEAGSGWIALMEREADQWREVRTVSLWIS